MPARLTRSGAEAARSFSPRSARRRARGGTAPAAASLPRSSRGGRPGGDHFEEACGVFGVAGHEEAANIAYLGLHALQHRGQESAGIATQNGLGLQVHRQMGLVQEAFGEETLARLGGRTAIGHVRYSTAGGSSIRNAQPLCVETCRGPLAVAHNGNIPGAWQVRKRLERAGSIFQTRVDTEVLLHLVARAEAESTVEAIAWSLGQLEGAYSLVMLTGEGLVAARDPHGFRPLCLGRLGDATVVASESCAFDLIGARLERDIEPGELVVVDGSGVRSSFPLPRREPSLCIFELIYFARPDSVIAGQSVYEARKRLGRELAREQPAEADLVIPVPDSGTTAAMGYAEVSGLPFEMGLMRSHYVGRTFIEPQQSIRHFGVKLKLAPVRRVLEGRRIVVVDDSVVRGTTSRKIAVMLKEAGAAEVHLRISSPPTRWPCFYGIDTPERDELVAAERPAEEVARLLGVESLGYLSVEGVHRAVSGSGYCDACFTGCYPVAVGSEDCAPLPRVVAV